jgi:hypothetical protein
MPIYKIQIKANGQIEGYQKIFAEEESFLVDGIEVNELFFNEVSRDLSAAINNWRFYSGRFIRRPNMSCVFSKKTISADGTDTITITNIPAPAIIIIDEQAEETSMGELTFTVDLPGTYIIKIECFPYITKEYTVTAV